MRPSAILPSADLEEEIPLLIETLLATEERLVKLTSGEVDAVAGQDGRTFLLQRAQEQLRLSEAVRQSALLNALPAHIALLDAQGGIVSVNEAWLRFGQLCGGKSHQLAGGVNYLAVCDGTIGPETNDAKAAAAGIRSVLAGTTKRFSFEYPCDSPNEKAWFLMMVTPIKNALIHGAVVMHVDITERKRAEETARESNERFAGAFEQAPIGVALVAPDGRWLKVNQAMCELTGYSENEMIARTFQEITHPADLARDLDQMHRVLAGEIRTYQLEKRYLHARGHPVSVLLNVSLVHDREGQPSYFIAQIQDITERKRLEARLRRLVDSDAQGVIFWNTKGEITDANDAFLHLSGFTREDVKTGRINWLAMTPPEYAHLDQRALRELAATGVCATYEKEWIRADGSRVPIMLGAAMFEDNPNDGLCFALDLTERRKSEGKLQASEKRFKVLFEQAAVGVALTDVRDGRYVQANQRFCEIAGRTATELAKLTFAAITHPQDIDRDLAGIRELTRGDVRELNWEKRYLRKDGSEVWVDLTVSPMWAPGETPDFCVVIAQDITARKKVEAQFYQAQKMEAIGTLAGGIAHDFNNVLASINGFTELVIMQLKGNPKLVEYLGSVLEASGRAADLVRQIMTFSRNEKPERRLMTLTPVVEEALKLLRATIPSTIAFDVHLDPAAPTVLASSTQVHQVMMNLGTNAWHAMKDHPGRLRVTLESRVVDEAYAATQIRLQPGLYARISVSDTGCGMGPSTLAKIFEPFFTTKPVGQGTGLGLAVVDGIMASHNGAVTVYSQPGEGTVFHLYFPAHSGETAVGAIDKETTPLGHGEKVLFVDDDTLLIELGKEALTAIGYSVEATQDPLAALEWVRREPSRFALVITDQTMPGMTGLTLAGELHRIRPGLPIILMTGYGADLTPERIATAHIRQLLLKPATLHALGTAARAALSTPMLHPPYG